METVEVNAEYLKRLKSEYRATPWYLLVGCIFSVFMGFWMGVVMTEEMTYNVCSKSGEVTYQSSLFIHDLNLNCQEKK